MCQRAFQGCRWSCWFHFLGGPASVYHVFPWSSGSGALPLFCILRAIWTRISFGERSLLAKKGCYERRIQLVSNPCQSPLDHLHTSTPTCSCSVRFSTTNAYKYHRKFHLLISWHPLHSPSVLSSPQVWTPASASPTPSVLHHPFDPASSWSSCSLPLLSSSDWRTHSPSQLSTSRYIYPAYSYISIYPTTAQ